MHDPERYETFKSAAAKDTAEFVPLLIQGMSWKKNEHILDYGCGAGSVTMKYLVPLAKTNNSTITALDISPEMLEYAKANYAHPLVTFLEGNILSSKFSLEQKFDRIFSIYVLHFMKDHTLALQRFFDMLKPGGELGFTVIGEACIYNILEILGESQKWGGYMKGYRDFLPIWYEDKEDCEECLRKAVTEIGFIVSEVRTVYRSREIKLNVWIEMFMSLNPFLNKIPAEIVPELKLEYEQIIRMFYKTNYINGVACGKYSAVVALVVKPKTK